MFQIQQLGADNFFIKILSVYHIQISINIIYCKSMEEELILLKFNNKELDDLNPLISKGYTLMSTDIVTAQLSIKNQQITQQQQLLLKIYIKKQKSTLQHIIIDILTDEDIFFHYRCQISSQNFKQINTQQQLSATYENLPAMLHKLIHQSINRQVQIYVTVMPEQCILLSFLKTVNHKQVNLISLTAVRPPASISNQLLAYRYNYLKTEIEKMSGRLLDVRDKLKLNPQLLLQFNKICES